MQIWLIFLIVLEIFTKSFITQIEKKKTWSQLPNNILTYYSQ